MQEPFSIWLILIAVFAVVAVVIGMLTFFKMRSNRDPYDLSSKIRARPAVIALIFALIIFLFGVGLTSFASAPSTITIGSGYITLHSSSFSIIPLPIEKNFTSSQISNAFVGQTGSGNFTLSRQYGTVYGDINIGVFTLGNGATAYVLSNNSTDLIIQLNNGQYVILGTSNTNALAASFSENVYPLKSP